MNSVQLIGNLTRDPELRDLPGGETRACNLRIAVDKPRRDGEEVPPNYFNVVVYGKQADTCGEYLERGRQIGVDGRLEYREWTTDDDQKRSVVEVVAERVDFLGGTRSRDEADAEPAVA